MNKFWKAALIRSARTFCQAIIAYVGTAAVLSEVDWVQALSAAVLAAVLSILNSVATGLPQVDIGE